ncbi:MAG: SOS response-associated peptidase [Bacillota bacterium]|jgi:putative SOS response-associated peptidase YedK
MCGRFTLTAGPVAVAERFGCLTGQIEFSPRYNVAPTQSVPVVLKADGSNRLKMMQWGLVPYWAKDKSIGSRLINARLETVAEKPAFRSSLSRRRCLVPADGYYEWPKVGRSKLPMRIVLPSRELFALAGLWDVWQSPEGEQLFTFTILTTEPASSVRAIHNRMPVILPPENEQLWLSNAFNSPDAIAALLSHLKPVEELEAYRVSTLVNNPANDSPECIAEVD